MLHLILFFSIVIVGYCCATHYISKISDLKQQALFSLLVCRSPGQLYRSRLVLVVFSWLPHMCVMAGGDQLGFGWSRMLSPGMLGWLTGSISHLSPCIRRLVSAVSLREWKRQRFLKPSLRTLGVRATSSKRSWASTPHLPGLLLPVPLNSHWKDWCWSWSSNTSANWRKELLTHWKRPRC